MSLRLSMSLLLYDFTDWLASKWAGDFHHAYRVTGSLHWKWYRQNFGTDTWTCTSLSDALRKYSWAGKDYEGNKKSLASCATNLQDSLLRGHDADAYACCTRILDWGNVRARATTEWLTRLSDSGRLCRTLSEAIASLRGGETSCFDVPAEFLMNSGTTKIYSLGDSSDALIIYDGRVGAALGYLAARYLALRGVAETPEELGFMWGASRPTRQGQHRRNPSVDPYRFRELGVGNKKNRQHANMVARGSRLIANLSQKTGVTPREWEAALFMVGYELPASTFPCTVSAATANSPAPR